MENNTIPVYDPNIEPIFDVVKLKSLLPHRYPFLLVDKVIEMGDDYIVGLKNVTVNEPFFQGHFPDQPIMPGVLQIEAMAQVGGLLVLKDIEDPENYSTLFAKIDNVKFRRQVVPGDTLLMKLQLTAPIKMGIVKMHGTVYVGGSIVSEADMVAQVAKKK